MTDKQVWLGWPNWYGMVISSTFPKAVGVTSAIMARRTGRDIWAAELLAIGIAVLLVALAALSMSWLREKLAPALARQVSPWAAKAADLVMAGLMALAYVAGSFVFLAHVQFFFLPQTPLIVFIICIAIISVVASLMGMEVLARVGLLGAVGHVLLTAVTAPGVLWDMNSVNLFPVGGEGIGPFLEASAIALADFSLPIALAAGTLPLVGPSRKGWVKHSVLAMLLAGGLVFLWPLSEILVLGPHLTAQSAVSCMVLARAASLGMYVHRYELIMLLFFLPGVFLAAALPLYGAASAVTRILGMKRRQPVVLVAGLALAGLSYWLLGNRLYSVWFFGNVWPAAVLACSLTLLLFMVGGGLIARSKARQTVAR